MIFPTEIHIPSVLVCLGCYNKYLRLGGLNSRCSFLIFLGAGKSKIKVLSALVLSEVLLGLQKSAFLLCSFMAERERPVSSLVSRVKALLPSWGSPSPWPYLNLIVSQRPYLQILLHWGIGFQYTNFRGWVRETHNSIHETIYVTQRALGDVSR